MLKSMRFAALLVALVSTPALAETNGTLRIGVLNDMSSVYADFQGPGSVLAAQMAIEDFAKTIETEGRGDFGRSPEQTRYRCRHRAALVRRRRRRHDRRPAEFSGRAGGKRYRQEKNKVAIGSGAGTALLTGAKCSPNFVHWTYDTWANGHALARGVLATGGKSWFFITADYAFGHDLEKQASDEILASGGKIIGTVRHPLGAYDFSSFILQAQSSGAQVVALANAGGDTTNTVKQAAEFKLAQNKKSYRSSLTCRACRRSV